MDIDVTVDIWVGVKFDEEREWPDFAEFLPEKLFGFNLSFDKDDEYWDEYKIIYKLAQNTELIVGVQLEVFPSEVGFGIRVFHHDWSSGVVAFDLRGVGRKIAIGTGRLVALFAEWGIDPATIGVWCTIDR